MARPERFEAEGRPRPTNWRKAAPFEPSYSIQLSYGRVEEDYTGEILTGHFQKT